MWCISVCFLCVCLIIRLCVLATCVWVCELYTVPACVHSRSHFLILRSDAGLSFESRAHNDISFRQHTSRHHGTTQRHFWPRGRGSIMLDTFIGEVCAPLFSYTLLPSSSSFFFLDWCLYSRLLCLPDHQRASQTSMAVVRWAWPAFPICFSFTASLFSNACSSTNGYCYPLIIFEIFLFHPSILDFLPPSPSLGLSNGAMTPRAKCLVKKWPPTGLCLTLCPNGQKACVCLCVCVCACVCVSYTEGEKQTGQSMAGTPK